MMMMVMIMIMFHLCCLLSHDRHLVLIVTAGQRSDNCSDEGLARREVMVMMVMMIVMMVMMIRLLMEIKIMKKDINEDAKDDDEYVASNDYDDEDNVISHLHGSDSVALLDAAGAAGDGEEELEAEGGQVLHGEGVLAVKANFLDPAMDGVKEAN